MHQSLCRTCYLRPTAAASAFQRTWAVIFSTSDEVMLGLPDWMQRERISGTHLTAISAYSSALFGWFDKDRQAYRNIVIGEQVECISLIGDK